jgi:hypothetical protein
MCFPGDQPDGVPVIKRQCMNFREVVSLFPGNKKTPSLIAEHFRSFYLGFNPGSIIWFANRDDDNHFETLFSFDDIHGDDENRIAFVEIIKPGILPSCVFGKDQSATYKFYNPSVSARQLGFGQLPIGLYFSDLIKPREIIHDNIHYCRLLDRVLDSATINLDSRKFSSFSSLLFNIWWAEWYDHLFCVSPRIYCEKLDPDYGASADEIFNCLVCFSSFPLSHADSLSFPFQPDTIDPLPPAKAANKFIISHRDELHISFIMPLQSLQLCKAPRLILSG